MPAQQPSPDRSEGQATDQATDLEPGGDWLAPTAPRAISARLELPGSKSITNRALILAALAQSPTRIGRPLRARDTELMAAAIGALGATVTAEGDGWLVTPGWLDTPATVDVGNAG